MNKIILEDLRRREYNAGLEPWDEDEPLPLPHCINVLKIYLYTKFIDVNAEAVPLLGDDDHFAAEVLASTVMDIAA